jgi:hypothetical protein
MRHPPSRALRLRQSAVAIALIAALASWQPGMLVTMAGPAAGAAPAAHPVAGPHGPHGAHGAHHRGPSHHHPLPFQCCTLCPLACAGAVALPSVPLDASAPALARMHRPQGQRTTARTPVRQHRLPFPLGPPTLRIA